MTQFKSHHIKTWKRFFTHRQHSVTYYLRVSTPHTCRTMCVSKKEAFAFIIISHVNVRTCGYPLPNRSFLLKQSYSRSGIFSYRTFIFTVIFMLAFCGYFSTNTSSSPIWSDGPFVFRAIENNPPSVQLMRVALSRDR